jgi:hypothetical protein
MNLFTRPNLHSRQGSVGKSEKRFPEGMWNAILIFF